MRLSPRAIRDMIHTELDRQVGRIRGQVVGAVARAVLREVQTGGGFARATVDLRADEEREDVEVLEPYGFTSAAPAGSEGVALAVGGDASHHVVLALGNRSLRLKALKDGEVAVYSREGQTILLKTDGNIVVTVAPTKRIELGGEGPNPNVTRVGDKVKPTTTFTTVISAIAAVVNGVVPGTVTPAQLVQLGLQIGENDTNTSIVGAAGT